MHLFLVAMPGALVAMHVFLVAMPGVSSSDALVPGSDARSP